MGKLEPAGSFDVFHELGDELLAEAGAEVARVELHIPLQHHVEKHPPFSLVLIFFFYFNVLRSEFRCEICCTGIQFGVDWIGE